MLHQLIITVLLPLVTATTPVPNEPIVVEDSQVQELCYISPRLCEKRESASSNG